jgi:hypothetical protein
MNTKAQRMALDLPAPRGVRQDRSREATRAGDSLLCALLVVYLASLLVDGVLRYVLAMAGLPNVIYLRDAIPVATLVVLFLRYLLSDGRVDLAIAVPAAILAFQAAYAAMLAVPSFSIAFGLKIFMFIPYGMAMWPLVRRRIGRTLTIASVMFGITLAGVAVNFSLGQMPWEGVEYQTAFGAISTTRMWWTEGISRLPGFARTSFDAAMILGITGLLTLLKFQRLMAQMAIVGGAIAGIVLTTSKGMAVVFPLAAVWLVVQQRRPWMSGRALVGTLCVTTLVLPFIIVLFDLGMSRSSFPSLLVSVWDRFTMMWPFAFRLLPEGPHALLGAGLGSIGTPQLFGTAAHRYNPGDNFAVLMMVTFGLPGLCYYAFPALSLRKVAANETVTAYRAYVGLLVLAYGYGTTTNMVEQSFFSVCFGLCCGLAASAWLRSGGQALKAGEPR